MCFCKQVEDVVGCICFGVGCVIYDVCYVGMQYGVGVYYVWFQCYEDFVIGQVVVVEIFGGLVQGVYFGMCGWIMCVDWCVVVDVDDFVVVYDYCIYWYFVLFLCEFGLYECLLYLVVVLFVGGYVGRWGENVWCGYVIWCY